MGIVYLNGSYIDAEQATIPIGDRGLLFGDGVFETARLHNGHYFRFRQHLERLANSAHILRLDIPELERLEQVGYQLAERNQLSEGSLRITVTRGPGGRGLHRIGAGPRTVFAVLNPVAPGWRERAAAGWAICTASFRRPAAESIPPALKGLGRPYALLAHYEAEENGCDDALLLSSDDFIAEGPTWNVFWRVGSIIRTPALDAGILEGVTRSIILDLARQTGFQVEEGRYRRSELDHADEIFATMTSSGVVPFTMLDGRTLAVGADSAAARLQDLYWRLVDAEVAQMDAGE